MDTEVVVLGDGVDDGRGEGTAQGEIVLDKQIPPRRDDPSDGLGEGLGFPERPLELVEDGARARSIASVMSCVLPPGK